MAVPKPHTHIYPKSQGTWKTQKKGKQWQAQMLLHADEVSQQIRTMDVSCKMTAVHLLPPMLTPASLLWLIFPGNAQEGEFWET